MTMCSFAAKDFDAAIRSFVIAQSGLIMPRPPIQFERTRAPSPQVESACQPADSQTPPRPAVGGHPFEEAR